jgi:hypothetical protein
LKVISVSGFKDGMQEWGIYKTKRLTNCYLDDVSG